MDPRVKPEDDEAAMVLIPSASGVSLDGRTASHHRQ